MSWSADTKLNLTSVIYDFNITSFNVYDSDVYNFNVYNSDVYDSDIYNFWRLISDTRASV